MVEDKLIVQSRRLYIKSIYNIYKWI